MFNTQYNRKSGANTPIYFDDFITRDQWRLLERLKAIRPMLTPATNITETREALIIELVAPGLEAEDLHIHIHERGLEIRYQYDGPGFIPIDESQNRRREYAPQSFRRTFDLNPEALDLGNIEVDSRAGIIQFTIPKQEPYRGKIMQVWGFSRN